MQRPAAAGRLRPAWRQHWHEFSRGAPPSLQAIRLPPLTEPHQHCHPQLPPPQLLRPSQRQQSRQSLATLQTQQASSPHQACRHHSRMLLICRLPWPPFSRPSLLPSSHLHRAWSRHQQPLPHPQHSPLLRHCRHWASSQRQHPLPLQQTLPLECQSSLPTPPGAALAQPYGHLSASRPCGTSPSAQPLSACSSYPAPWLAMRPQRHQHLLQVQRQTTHLSLPCAVKRA
mmetsp:Transcript_102135/g.192157  ORF Transcript_102135/g.192157 Transcript_102135/m.192157 type:complete len:229 (-) Transcript_102135:72-758(-)